MYPLMLYSAAVPKPKNLLPSETVEFSTTPQVRAYLAQLVAGGLHGKSVAEAAERLVTLALSALLRDGGLRPVQAGRTAPPAAASDSRNQPIDGVPPHARN